MEPLFCGRPFRWLNSGIAKRRQPDSTTTPGLPSSSCCTRPLGVLLLIRAAGLLRVQRRAQPEKTSLSIWSVRYKQVKSAFSHHHGRTRCNASSLHTGRYPPRSALVLDVSSIRYSGLEKGSEVSSFSRDLPECRREIYNPGD